MHGDDFVFVGEEKDLRWVQELMEVSFLVKVIGQVCGDSSDLKELRVLNQVLRWTEAGILLEADPRHQVILTAAEPGCAVLTPSVKEQMIGEVAEKLATLLSAESTGVFRSEAARCNFLGLHRLDVASAAKELCRRMSSPDKASQLALQCLVRYLTNSLRFMAAW